MAVLRPRLPTMPNFLRGYADTCLTDTLQPPEGHADTGLTHTEGGGRKASVVSLPPLDGAWLQQLDDYPQRRSGFEREVR